MEYIKVIRMTGSFFARQFNKKEKYKKNVKYREVDSNTVKEQFLKGLATVEVIFEDLDRDAILLNIESEKEQIKKYLGTDFID